MRNTLRAIGALSTATGLALAVAMPAQAGHYYERRCEDWASIGEKFQMCIYEGWDHAFWGDFTFWNYNSTAITVDGTLIVQRCKAGGVDCVTISAHTIDMAIGGNSSQTMTTWSKAGTYGYTYRTCSSGTSTGTNQSPWVMACTPTNSYTPL